MSNKAYLEFEGFNEAIARLNKLNANTKNISEKSLKKTHEKRLHHIMKLRELKKL